MRPRAHRINGRWGRFAELWVPEPLRNSRVDPGRRGMIVLVLVAAVAGSAFYGALALLERAVTFWHPSFRRS